jgi:spermidine synthase
MTAWFLYVVVFVSGATVLAIEILGTRILGPFYGVSLFLWSALITVTLVALSVGYAIGGRWADRGPTMMRVYYLLAGAGVWTLMIPWITDPVLAVSEPLGLRVAVLVAAFLLFVPPLTLLGMVSPYAIRVRAESLSVVGQTAGDLYAISTVGSVVAALMTGFLLIPNIGVGRLTFMTGGLLLATAGLGMAMEVRSRSAASALAIVLAAGAGILWQWPFDRPDPARGVVAIEQSPYAEIRVLDAPDGRTRMLVIDGGVHTIARPSSWESYYPYVALMGLARCLREEPGRLLLIGVGGGSVMKDFAAQGWGVDAVEIDPVVVEVAREYFGLAAADGEVHTMDGRQFLRSRNETYDVIAVDAFGSSSIPFHLVTGEVFGLMASRLGHDGILAINLEATGWHAPIVRAIAATLRPHFAHVLALPAEASSHELGNVVVFASNSAIGIAPGRDRDAAARPSCSVQRNGHARRAWENRFVPDIRGAAVLSDDLNPVDLWSEQANLVARLDLHRYFRALRLESY